MQHHKPLEIFVSYSHRDSAWCQRLFKDYVSTTFGDCRIWTDEQIRVGERWDEEIAAHLENSQVAVLLVSADFLASAYIMQRELPRILARAQAGAMRVVWLPIAVTEAEVSSQSGLTALQGACACSSPLPASPLGCDDAELDAHCARLRRKLMQAVDPLGAELAHLVENRYEVDYRLAEGNLAAVYKAHDRVLRREVVIKVLKDKGQRDAFMSDVRDAIRTSEQPNFINVYDVAPQESTAYCVVQFIRGKTLAERMREHQPHGLPVGTLREVFTGVATALARAHALGVTYGNIKPSNIFVDASNDAFILPVGRRPDRARDERRLRKLAERLHHCDAAGEPASDADLEDLAYLVPDHFGEQLDPADRRLTDQYMLGLLAFEMATGQRPDRIADPTRLLQDGRAAFADLPAVNTLRRLCPQRLSDMVARMTARHPRRRYPSLEVVLEELRQFDDLSLVIARDSYRRCAAAPDFDTTFFSRFYAEFLRRCPPAAGYFQRFDALDWQRQHRMLKEAVLLLFAFRQRDGVEEPNVLSRVAASHPAIPAWIYDQFTEALIGVVCGDAAAGLSPFDAECSDPTVRDALDEHWRAALEPGMAYMKLRASMVHAAPR